MAHEVHVSVEARRGCGYRKPDKSGVGIYLMGDGLGAPCGLLPFPLEICPCCGGGIKPTRGFTWVTPELLFQRPVLDALAGIERHCDYSRSLRTVAANHASGVITASLGCRGCPIGSPPAGLHGLLWIGEAFYPTPEDFTREAERLGVSRKIPALPKRFKVGETWLFLAHRKAVRNEQGERALPGVFTAYRPTRVDLVIADERNIPKRAQKLAERLGDQARLVRVIPEADAQQALPGTATVQ